MNDNSGIKMPRPISRQIRDLRRARGWSLAELARRAGTSPPALHRYENGWDRFGLHTLGKIAEALEARLEVRLVPRSGPAASSRPSRARVVSLLSPLFWDRPLTGRDLETYPDWVIERVLMYGSREQVAALRSRFDDPALLRAVRRRGIDPRTRNYWRLMLEGETDAPEGAQR